LAVRGVLFLDLAGPPDFLFLGIFVRLIAKLRGSPKSSKLVPSRSITLSDIVMTFGHRQNIRRVDVQLSVRFVTKLSAEVWLDEGDERGIENSGKRLISLHILTVDSH
jgi:hypothetical protein